MNYTNDSVYFSGSAKLPSTIPSGEIYDFLNIGLVINTKTGIIEDTSITLLSAGAVRFLDYLIIGFNLHEDGINTLINKIETRYFGSTQKSICVAIKQAYEKYNLFKNN